MKTFEWLAERAGEIERDAEYYKGDIAPRVYKVWCEGPFVVIDVCYHSKGYAALYELDTRTGEFCVAQD